MSSLKILGTLAAAGFTGYIALHILQALGNAEVDGQSVLLALAMITGPICAAFWIKLDLDALNQPEEGENENGSK